LFEVHHAVVLALIFFLAFHISTRLALVTSIWYYTLHFPLVAMADPWWMPLSSITILTPMAIAGIIGIDRGKKNQAILAEMASQDHLTRSLNRHYFTRVLEHQLALAQRDQVTGALILFDLNHLKKINDSMGHYTGDKVLAEFARRIDGATRKSDLTFRIGGDEFAILLSSPSSIPQVMERIISAVKAPFTISEEQTLEISAAAGVALFPEHSLDFQEIFKFADDAMYRAKQSGKDYLIHGS